MYRNRRDHSLATVMPTDLLNDDADARIDWSASLTIRPTFDLTLETPETAREETAQSESEAEAHSNATEDWGSLVLGREHEGPYAVDTIPGGTSSNEILNAPGSRSSTIDFSGDTDWFRITLNPNQIYSIFVTGNGPNGLSSSYLQLFSSTGQFLTSDTDGNWPSLITGGGTFFLAVGAPVNIVGDYTVTIASIGQDSISDNTTTNAVLTIDGPAVSTGIEFAGDRDWFRIELVAGESYVFSMTGSDGTPLTDPFLELRNSFGSIISIDDDGGPGTNAMMQYTALTSGVYYLSARAYSGGQVGQYTISAATGEPQDPLDTLDLGFTFDTNAITVYFAVDGQTLGPMGEALRDWSAAEITAAMSALGTISNVVNLTFTQVGSAAAADFIFALTDLETGVLGQTWPSPSQAYIEFAPDASGWTALGLLPGGLGYSVLIHEVGHALGLDHPHYDGGDTQVMQGVTDIFDDYGDFLLNQQVFTIMSYNDGWPMGGATNSPDYGYAATPMALDIAALQAMYGANTTYNNGDTTYHLPNSNSSGASYISIWDTGGIDTIVAGSRSATINLNSATLLNQVNGGGYVSDGVGIYGGLTIAAGVIIENAIGGSGNDQITGNDVDNRLEGGAGDIDRLWGHGGNDTLIGGDGNDELDGGVGADYMAGGAGMDQYIVDNAGDVVVELANEGSQDQIATSLEGYVLPANVERLGLLNGVITGFGNADANLLGGNDQDNVLDGGAGADSMQGAVGNDTYIFDNDGDSAYDTSGYDTIKTTATNTTAGNGIDEVQMLNGAISVDGYYLARVIGNENDNFITGSQSGAAEFFGHGGNDNMRAWDGDDDLYGGEGNDHLNGGAGADLLDGGNGFDYARYDYGNWDPIVADLVSGGSAGTAAGDIYIGIEGLVGTEYDDILRGDLGANTIEGGVGNDTLAGREGNDQLNGGAGADAIDGGDGFDTVRYDGAAAGVTIYVDASYANMGEAAGDTTTSIEGFVGSTFNDYMVGGTANNTLQGFGGADILEGHGGDDLLDGGEGDDALQGGLGGDILDGGNGFDTARYDGAVAGVTIYVDAAYANLGEAAGDFHISIEGIVGSTFGDYLVGGTANNILQGFSGHDVLEGHAGNDLLDGGDGNDQMNGGIGGDIFDGGAGFDTVRYDGATAGVIAFMSDAWANTGEAAGDAYISIESLYGSNFNDTLAGASNANELQGFDGVDFIYGYAGTDFIGGGGGDDFLDGGADADGLQGGGGADQFVFRANEAEGDNIVDFDGASGDNLLFIGYGTAAAGATFTQINATQWQITSADGLITDIITLANGATIDPSDYAFG